MTQMSTTGGAEYLKYSSKGQPGQEDTFKNIWTELYVKFNGNWC